VLGAKTKDRKGQRQHTQSLTRRLEALKMNYLPRKIRVGLNARRSPAGRFNLRLAPSLSLKIGMTQEGEMRRNEQDLL
jgi:hypothetical protein